MPISVELRTKKMKRRHKSPYEVFPDHLELRERLRKTLYYGKLPETDRPSLPMTEVAVGVFQEMAPRGLGKVDTQWASSIGRRACVSPCSLMLGMLYLDRLKNKNPEYLQKVSSSDLFLVSMMVASKYLYDEGVDEEVFNDEWAESAKMECDDLNDLERDFLDAIEWSLFVKPEDFRGSLMQMEKRIAKMKGLEQGYYMYSDLMVLSGDERFLTVCKHLLQEVYKVMLVCSVAYVASILTMVGATVALGYLRSSVLLPLEGGLRPTTPYLPVSSDNRQVISDVPENDNDLGNLSTAMVDGEETIDEMGQRLAGVVRLDAQLHLPPATTKQTPDESPGRRSFGIQAPGLLTLTLLKDTVIHFMLGVKQQWTGKTTDLDLDTHGDWQCEEETRHLGKCSCPNCPAKKVAAKQNLTQEHKASQLELNKDVIKNCMGKLPCWCTANAAPAKHGTEFGNQRSSSSHGPLPKICEMPVGTPYQVVTPLGADLGIRVHSMTKTLVV